MFVSISKAFGTTVSYNITVDQLDTIVAVAARVAKDFRLSRNIPFQNRCIAVAAWIAFLLEARTNDIVKPAF